MALAGGIRVQRLALVSFVMSLIDDMFVCLRFYGPVNTISHVKSVSY